jgi:hypothetical protein
MVSTLLHNFSFKIFLFINTTVSSFARLILTVLFLVFS